MLPDLKILADADFCYLTTRGRVSGRPHSIEIWFALHGHILYMLSGGRDQADWVKNALRSPAVQVKINNTVFSGQARLVNDTEEDALARRIVFEKYTPRSSDDLADWSRRRPFHSGGKLAACYESTIWLSFLNRCRYTL